MRDRALDKAAKRFFAAVGGDGEPDAPPIAAVLARVLRGSGRAMTHLHRAGDESFVVNPSTFAARAAADPCLVDLDMLIRATANAIPIGTDHSAAAMSFITHMSKGVLIAPYSRWWRTSMSCQAKCYYPVRDAGRDRRHSKLR